MKINENARQVLEKRYLTKNGEGKIIESIEELFERVAKTIGSADINFDKNADTKKTIDEFYEMMTELDFLPNSPTLMNAGRPLGQLSACFVLPIDDTMEEIFETIKNAALIHKSGGGTGFSFSRLRSKGATVNTTGGKASGPVSFMKVFNAATEAVKQGGTRRGANMGILRIDHPDILDFIDCKKNNEDITNFNISVGITEKFMQAVINNSEYDLIEPSSKKTVGKLNAKEVYDKIVNAAWSNGEPGIIFLDRLNKFNPVPSQGEIESTNPCGEQPLLPYESCNLGSINLSNMLKKSGDKYVFDFAKFESVIKKAVHFLDNVIEVNKYPLDMIDKTTRSTRKIGLGVMGFADVLLKLGINYNSEECVAFAEKIMKFVSDKGKEASCQLAEKRGAFPLFDKSIFADGKPIRNAAITTIAPTGTLSIIAGCSSGIEPVFGYVFVRNVMDNTELIETNPILKEELENRGLYTESLMKKIAQESTLLHINEIPDDIKSVFVCAHDILPEYHIKVQAAFQKYTDNAVSKTVNFPNTATIQDVDDVYMLAYKTGCKGVTIYRDGSRQFQVLNIGKVNKQEEAKLGSLTPRPRPDVVMGFTEKVQIGCGNLYITVNYDEKGIVEVFTNTGKAGGCPSQSEATARLVSVGIRSGMDVNTIIEQLKGIRCPSTIRQPGMKVTSCPDAIAKVIAKVVKMQTAFTAENTEVLKPLCRGNEKSTSDKEKEEKVKAGICPECGKKLEHEGGCVICRECGYSKCS
jgi:ribonucleoside-diphosphate reductase alpha chain